MKKVILSIFALTVVFSACKKDEVKKVEVPKIIGTWQIVQTQTTHELGHYGPYDPPVRVLDSRETLSVDHQNNFTIIDVSSSSLTWVEFDSIAAIYTWEQTEDIFSLSSVDTVLDYHIIELTDETFMFFIKDFNTYNDSTDLVAYEEFQYTYLLEKL